MINLCISDGLFGKCLVEMNTKQFISKKRRGYVA
nr:MAG TPA: hypothetical protein [Caudoviricetes sp.]